MTPEQAKMFDDDELILTFRKLRASLEKSEEEFKKRQEPVREAKQTLETEALRRMLNRNMTSFTTEHGTCFRTDTVSVITKDRAAFRAWLDQTGKWDMADLRPAKKEIQNFADEHFGDLPPGVSMTRRLVAQFRAPTNK